MFSVFNIRIGVEKEEKRALLRVGAGTGNPLPRGKRHVQPVLLHAEDGMYADSIEKRQTIIVWSVRRKTHRMEKLWRGAFLQP